MDMVHTVGFGGEMGAAASGKWASYVKKIHMSQRQQCK